MLSNNNRAFVRSLSWSCLKTSKNRNFIAVIAIILTTMLFTSVATILEGSEQTSKEQMIRTSGSKFMMSIKYISQEASDELEQDSAFSKVGKLQYLGSIDNQELRKIPVDFVWANKTLMDGFFVEMKAGKLPEDDVREIEPRLLVFAASALFSFVTVRISGRKPIRLMARMSPIQALRYQGNEAGKSKQTKGRESKHRIFQMALSNFTGSKGKSFFVVLSLSLSVVILNSVLNFTNCLDQETFVRGQSGADFVVSHLDFGVSSESEQNVIPQAFLTEASKRQDVEKEGAVYCYQAPDAVAESALSGSDGDYDGILTAKVRTVNGKPYTLRRELGKMLFAFDQEVWKRRKVVSGRLDMEKLKTGKYIVEVSEFINNGQDYDESLFSLKPGDKVNAVIGDTKLEYEVLANVVVQPMILFSSSMGEGGYLALPSEEYLKLFPGKLPIHYVMDAKGDSFDDINVFLKNYEEKAQANIKYTSTEKIIQDYKDFKGIYASTGAILAAIFGSIGLLNLLNVILASAAARQREFAIMQSIGMTRKQLRSLFVIEGLLYSAVAGVLSMILASILSWTVVRQLCGMEWFCVYHFSLLPAMVLIPLYLVMSAAMAFVIDRLWNNGSIVERLRVSK